MGKRALILTLSTSVFTGSTLAEGKNDNEEIMVVSSTGSAENILSGSDLNRFRGIANADIFSSETYIQSNNMRNEAGSIDPGIRGLQGEGRVPVFIDGSLQSTHTSRGYQGTSDRTYIDPDLISNITISKGASQNNNAFSSGAIGGVINIKTLTTEDIINPGNSYGLLLKLRTFNNNKKPDIPDDYAEQSYYQLTDKPRGYDFRNGSATLAFGFRDDSVDTVFAYSKRSTGNYFSGKNGFKKFKDPVVFKNEEVVNTYFESESFIYKLALNANDNHHFNLAYRNHRQQAGETLAAYWYKNANDIDFEPLPAGVESMPQWKPGSAIVNAYSAGYTYTPVDNRLINLNLNYWLTDTNLKQYNGLWALGTNAQQYLHAYSNNKNGIAIVNESQLNMLTLRYGSSTQKEKLAPKSDGLTRFTAYPTSRHGERRENALFVNGMIESGPLQVNMGINYHNSTANDFQTNKSVKYQAKADLSAEISYALTPGTTLFVKAARNYRMPSLYETTVSNEIFSYNPADPIAPEVSLQKEVGVKIHRPALLSTEDTLDLSLSWFNNRTNNFISPGIKDKTAGMPAWQDNFTFMNYDKLDLSGFDFSLKYSSDLFYSAISATLYSKTAVCSNYYAQKYNTSNCNNMGFAWGLTPTRIPAKQNISVNLGKKFLNETVDAGIRYRYHSAKTNPAGWLEGTAANPVIEIPSGYQIDLYGEYILNKNATFFAAVNNVTDRYDIQPGAVISMPDPGRTVMLGVDLRF